MAVLTAANIALLNARGTALARVPDIVLGSRLQLLDSDGTYTGTLGEAVVAVGGVGGIAANDIVYVSGSSGTSRLVLPADADAIATMRNLYYAKAAIVAGASGYVYKRGLMTAQNTNAATVGDPVYADTTTAGGWTLTKPSGAADIIVEIGIVTVKSSTVGVIDVDIGAGVLEFDVHSLTGLGAAPAIDDRLVISDENVAGDPHLYITVQELFNGIAGTTSFTGAVVKDTDQLFLDDAGVVKRTTFQVLMNGIEDLTGTDVTFVKDTDTLLVSDGGVAVNVTYQVLMNGVNDLTAVGAAPALTDSVLLDDAGVAKKLTVQNLFDGAFTLAADNVQTGDFFMLLESGGVAKLESISDLGDFMAGTGLSASGGVLAVSPTESAAADVVPTTDAMLFLDSTDSNIQKQESIQHFLDSVDDLVAFTGVVAPAADKLLYLDAGVAKVATAQVLFDGVDDLTALAAAPALTDKVLLGDAGTAKSLTIQYLLDGVAGLAADTVADGDSFLLSESGGVSKLEAIADLATLFAGTGLTAASSVIGVDTTQALETISGTSLVLNSTNLLTLQIGTVDILAVDDGAITMAAAATTVAGQDCYAGTEAGGVATTGDAGAAGALLSLKAGDASSGCATENEDGAVGGALTLESGAGGGAGLDAAGTADGKDGGLLTVVAGDGGLGGATSGTGGDGGAISIEAGNKGAANTDGTEGEINIGIATASKITIGRATKVLDLPGVVDVSAAVDTALASGDHLLFNDATDSNYLKREAMDDVATLLAGAGLTATSSVIAVSQASHWTFLIGGANGEDTDGVLTNSGGVAGGSIPTGVTQTEAASTFCKSYDKTNDEYQDVATSSAGTDMTNNYQFFSDTKADDDAVLFGAAVQFCEIGIDMSATVQNYTGDALTWSYSQGGTSWGALTINYDGTDATAQDGKRSFGQDGVINFVPPPLWLPNTIDGQEAYYIRAAISTTANIGANEAQTNSKEHLVVSPDGDAFTAPHDGNISKIRVTNTGATIHNQAIKFILFDFTKGTYSVEMTWTASQNTDTFSGTDIKAGSAGVDVDAGDKLGILITDDAGSTVNPTNVVVELTVTPA